MMMRLRGLMVFGLPLVIGAFLFANWQFRPGRDLSVSPAPTIPVQASGSPGDFWTAMRRLELEPADDWNEDQLTFARGLKHAMNGNRHEAIAILRPLHETASDRDLRLRTGAVLVRLYEGVGAPGEVVDLLDESAEIMDGTKIDASDREFAQAFVGLPPEAWTVPNEPAAVDAHVGWFGQPDVKVSINGCRRRLVLDTGASATVIGSHVARDCDVHPQRLSLSTGTSTSHEVKADVATIDRFAFGPVEIRNHHVAIVQEEDLSFGPVQFDGAVGWPVIERLRLEVDYGREIVHVGPSAGPGADSDRNFLWLGYPYVRLHAADGTALILELDTGAANSSIMDGIFQRGLELGKVEIRRGISMGVGGGERVSRRKIRDFTVLLSGYAFTFATISTRPESDAGVLIQPDGRLGSDIARGGVMVLDYPAGRFKLRLGD